jgi:hypothetical protein
LFEVLWKFDTVQVCPGGGGGGCVHSLAVQSCIVFGGGLNGTPGRTICEVVFQRTPGASARASVRKTAIDAAASRRQKRERIMRCPS